jgi:hypothetical protein
MIRWLSCSADGTCVSPSSCGADDTTAGSHASANVSVEDVVALAAAINVLLHGQDFLEQVRTVNALMHSPLLKSCLIWCYGQDRIFFIAI